ncbi:hypothetical protein JCM10213v2_004967 [Rhodosporidiobolus nylandii]
MSGASTPLSASTAAINAIDIAKHQLEEVRRGSRVDEADRVDGTEVAEGLWMESISHADIDPALSPFDALLCTTLTLSLDPTPATFTPSTILALRTRANFPPGCPGCGRLGKVEEVPAFVEEADLPFHLLYGESAQHKCLLHGCWRWYIKKLIELNKHPLMTTVYGPTMKLEPHQAELAPEWKYMTEKQVRDALASVAKFPAQMRTTLIDNLQRHLEPFNTSTPLSAGFARLTANDALHLTDVKRTLEVPLYCAVLASRSLKELSSSIHLRRVLYRTPSGGQGFLILVVRFLKEVSAEDVANKYAALIGRKANELVKATDKGGEATGLGLAYEDLGVSGMGFTA